MNEKQILEKIEKSREEVKDQLKTVAYFEPEREDEIEFLRRRV